MYAVLCKNVCVQMIEINKFFNTKNSFQKQVGYKPELECLLYSAVTGKLIKKPHGKKRI